MSSVAWTLTWLAAGAAALFAGGALYVSLVEHPARILTGPPMAVAQFRTSYPRGARLQGGLAALGTLAAVAAWWAGALLGLVVPYTLVAILPTNKRLMDPALAPDSPEARALLRRWTTLHAVR